MLIFPFTVAGRTAGCRDFGWMGNKTRLNWAVAAGVCSRRHRKETKGVRETPAETCGVCLLLAPGSNRCPSDGCCCWHFNVKTASQARMAACADSLQIGQSEKKIVSRAFMTVQLTTSLTKHISVSQVSAAISF